jgi:hypothetical protein
MSSHLYHLLHGTVLEYWLLHPHGQSYTFFFAVIVIALICVTILTLSIRRHERTVLRSKTAEGKKTNDAMRHPSAMPIPTGISKHDTPSPSARSTKNFSALAGQAPVTYATLLKNGMLDEHGSPTKKYKLLRLLER